jgi:pimeloyl-ACP methyl ester carboxylesterase
MTHTGSRYHIASAAGAGAVLLMVVIGLWAQAWALPIEPIEPKEHSGPITPSPTNLTAGTLSESQVIVNFKCGGNADGHEAWRRVGTTGTFARVAGTSGCPGTAANFRDRTVLPETTYCYRVRAFNSTNEAWSPILCVAVPVPTTPPAAPTVWLDTGWTTFIRIVFRDNSSSENYFSVFRNRVGDVAWTLVQTVPRSGAHRGTGEEITVGDFGLQPDTAYEYIVQAGYDPVNPALSTVAANSVPVAGSTLGPTVAVPPDACTSGAENGCDAVFQLPNGMPLTYYRNYPIDAPNANITRLVVVVHGMSRTAWNAFDAMVGAASGSGVLVETLIVAPYLRETQWGEGWRQGDPSLWTWTWPYFPLVSSFAAIDELVLAIADHSLFPALRDVVIAGHSAGGQFTQRYAATSRIEYSRPTLQFRYVVANPSSYMYLNDRRPSATGTFIVPTGCSGYNDYKYGLEDRNAYAAQVSDAEILGQYPAREVTYLLGGSDNFDDGTMETNCQANLQGPHRLARGTFYHQHMLIYSPGNYHRRVVVPGVGHNAWNMYGSLEGMLALFF